MAQHLVFCDMTSTSVTLHGLFYFLQHDTYLQEIQRLLVCEMRRIMTSRGVEHYRTIARAHTGSSTGRLSAIHPKSYQY